MRPRVAVFDIDGTLTETNRVDGEHYRAAVRAVLPSVRFGSFEDFTEFTDSAILRAICDRLPDVEYGAVESEVHDRLVAGLERALHSDPAAFSPVRGAPHVFDAVRRAGWLPAVATGAWRASAELKLGAAAIPMDGVPLATSTEAERRVDIIRRALKEASPTGTLDDVVYVGDGTWDLRACRELGIGFVGRATSPGRGGLLRRGGARVVLDDFGDPADLLGALEDLSALRP